MGLPADDRSVRDSEIARSSFADTGRTDTGNVARQREEFDTRAHNRQERKEESQRGVRSEVIWRLDRPGRTEPLRHTLKYARPLLGI